MSLTQQRKFVRMRDLSDVWLEKEYKKIKKEMSGGELIQRVV